MPPASLTTASTGLHHYDAENRLVSATGAGNTASYAYDASGRRKSKTVNGTTTLTLSDGDREVLEYDGTGTVLRRYTHGRGIDEVLNLVNADGSRAILVPDIQGSLIASVDSATGTITRQGVQAYGESADASGSFRYTGRRIDAETPRPLLLPRTDVLAGARPVHAARPDRVRGRGKPLWLRRERSAEQSRSEWEMPNLPDW